MKWARFLAAITPDLIALARALHSRFNGNLEDARAEISTIRNHGERYAAARAQVDRELAEARARDKGPPS